MDNSTIWSNIYDTSDFGNKYPSSYLVSLFHARIKPMLLNGKCLTELNVLDFACSIGANSRVFIDLGMNVYGIDVSKTAIQRIQTNDELGGVFKAANLLEPKLAILDIFTDVKFDFIVASECMYYFKNSEISMLVNKFISVMNENAVVYISIPSYDSPMYRGYKYLEKDQDGMIAVEKTGRIDERLFVNLPRDENNLIEMFRPLRILDVLTVNLPIHLGENNLGYHVLAKKER